MPKSLRNLREFWEIQREQQEMYREPKVKNCPNFVSQMRPNWRRLFHLCRMMNWPLKISHNFESNEFPFVAFSLAHFLLYLSSGMNTDQKCNISLGRYNVVSIPFRINSLNFRIDLIRPILFSDLLNVCILQFFWFIAL